MPNENSKNKEKGVLESAVNAVVKLVTTNSGGTGQASRDIKSRRKKIEDATRTKKRK